MMVHRNKIILTCAFSLTAVLASSVLAEQAPSSVKSMREKYEQMIKENKEKADQEMVRKEGKLNRTMSNKPSSALSDAERKEIAEGRRQTEEEADKSNRNRYKNQATSGLTADERKMIAESRGKTEKEPSKPAPKTPAIPSPALSDSEKPKEGQVLIAGEHMKTLYKDLKRLPTHNEFVNYLVKEMKIDASQAEKILDAMDID